MNYAPIVLVTYNRLEHLKKTIDALKNNIYATKSEIFIFSDGPKEGDEISVKKVRAYIKNIKGFKNISITERSTNNRPYNNRNGIKTISDIYEKFIFIEDDIVTSPYFLKYINEGLEIYKDNPKINAICGYTPPINIPFHYNDQTFLDPTFSSWGYGMWKNNFDNIEIPLKGFETFIENETKIKEFLKLGNSILNLVKADYNGVIDALDIKILFQQFKENKFSVVPKYSLVQNIGWDGSGEHCAETSRFDVDLSKVNSPIIHNKNLDVDLKILNLLKEFRDIQSKKKW